MNKALKAKWIAALRSGDYKQGQNFLAADDTFCCLGVLCDVVGVPYTLNDDGERTYDFGSGRTSDQMLRGDLRSSLNSLGCLDCAATVAEMNDEGSSFAEIADWIATHIPEEAA